MGIGEMNDKTGYPEGRGGENPALDTRMTTSYVPHPWKRYCARGIDSALYRILSVFLYFVVFRWVIRETLVLLILLWPGEIVLSLCIEPVLLSVCSTTPGKWIFGIRVTNRQGGKLSLKEAFERTWKVMCFGRGFEIPGYEIYRCWKSYKEEIDGEGHFWDEDCLYHIKDTRWDLWVKAVGCGVVFVLLFVFVFRMILLPVHRGDLTLSEFSRNFNQYRKLFQANSYTELDQEGKWTEFKEEPFQDVEISVNELPAPDFEYTVEDGLLTEVFLEAEYEGKGMVDGYVYELEAAVCAFAGASKSVNVWNGRMRELMNYLEKHKGESYHFTEGDITVDCRLECEGLEWAGLFLWPEEEGKEGSFHLEFSMKKDRQKP